MKRIIVACTLLLGFPAVTAAGGCDICRPQIICDPECAASASYRAARFPGGRDCEVIEGVCYEGGGYCQWADFRRDADSEIRFALLGMPPECSLETGI